jgi:hypothetical protein
MAYLTTQLAVDRELNRVLELAARQSAARVRRLRAKGGIGAQVRAAQLQQVLAELARIQADTWVSGIGPIIQRSYPKAQSAATRSFAIIENVLRDAVGERAAERLIQSFRISASQGLELDRVRRSQALSPRVYKNAALASGAVERVVRAGIIQQLSAKELAENVKKYISPTVPGGVSYAAMRLARTELNNAFHEAQKIEGEAPWVKGTKWNLSNSHPTGKPDECDLYATQNVHGLGKGVYPVDSIPDKPHPHCLCFMTHETKSETDMVDLLADIITGSRIA